MSWHTASRVAEENQSTELFTLVFRARSNAELEEVISISSRFTPTEAYDQELNHWDVALEFVQHDIALGEVLLLQNRPNPFNEVTIIGFELPEALSAKLVIQDASGKVIKVIRGDYAEGYHEVKLLGKDLPTGTLYYSLQTKGQIITKSMIRNE